MKEKMISVSWDSNGLVNFKKGGEYGEDGVATNPGLYIRGLINGW